MTGILERPTDRRPGAAAGPSRPQHDDVTRFRRLGAALAGRRRSLVWILPVLLVTGIAQAVGMGGAPARIDDEGTYTAQAWAVAKLGELAHYTFWYDHPPLGWLQLALYGQATFAFDRYGVAVIAMREAMLVAALISTALVFVLGRRLHLARPAAAAAALIFALSPLAIQFHRTVYLDNVALPWLLGAFVLALTKRNQLAAFAGSALCFGISVLSKETFLLALPVLAWVLWRSARPDTRRYTLSVAASLLVLVGGGYLLLAAVKGELFPGAGRVSLATGVAFQLATRQSSGSPFDPDSLITKTLSMWVQLDPVILAAGVVAGIAALFLTRMRPFAVLYLALVAFMFRPGGYLPVPFVIVLLPFAALLIAGVVERCIGLLLARRDGLLRIGAISGLVATAAAAVLSAPIWAGQLRGLWLADLDEPMIDAQQWVEDNVDRGDTVVVDDAMWVDLVRAGFPRQDVIWYYKVDTDPAVSAVLPNGWQDVDYVVTTDSMRTFPDGFPEVQKALENSTVVAAFGTGSQAVEVRAVSREGADAARADADAAGATRQSYGTQLAANPRLSADPDLLDLIRAGGLDSTAALSLAQLLAAHDVTVGDLPVVAGEDGVVRRQVLLTEVDGTALRPGTAATRAAAGWVRDLGPDYAPIDVRSTSQGLLLVFPLIPSA